MNLKIKVLFIFSLSLVFFLACEDEEGEDRPKELVGTWYLHEANSSLELTSKIDQTALDPFSKGTSSLSVKGNSSDILLNHMMLQYDPYSGEEAFILSNRPFFDDFSDDDIFPSILLILGKDDMGEQIAYMQAMFSPDEYGIYINESDFVYDKDNHSIQIADTLFAMNMVTGEPDQSDYHVLYGTYQAKTINLSANIPKGFDFPLGSQEIVSDQESMILEENGQATMSHIDSYDGTKYDELGEWHVEGKTLYIIVEIIDDYDGSTEIDSIVATYMVNGSDLTLNEEEDFCEGESPDDFDELSCYNYFELMFALQLNSILETNALLELKLNKTPHSAKRINMNRFNVDQIMDQFRQFKLK